MLGFGGAFTDAAGINIARLSQAAQENLMRYFFFHTVFSEALSSDCCLGSNTRHKGNLSKRGDGKEKTRVQTTETHKWRE